MLVYNDGSSLMAHHEEGGYGGPAVGEPHHEEGVMVAQLWVSSP